MTLQNILYFKVKKNEVINFFKLKNLIIIKKSQKTEYLSKNK